MFMANYTAKACGSPNYDIFACVMNGFAKGLAKTLRASGYSQCGLNGNNSYAVRGNATVSSPFVRV